MMLQCINYLRDCRERSLKQLKALGHFARSDNMNMPTRLGRVAAQVPVCAVMSSCDVAVNLQSSLVVHVSVSVTLQSFEGRRTAQQRLDVEREQLKRPERKYVQSTSQTFW